MASNQRTFKKMKMMRTSENNWHNEGPEEANNAGNGEDSRARMTRTASGKRKEAMADV